MKDEIPTGRGVVWAGLAAAMCWGLCSALCLASCVSVQPQRALMAGSAVEPGRPESSGAVAAGAEAEGDSPWPARWGAGVSPKGAIVPSAFGPERLVPAHLGRFHTLRVGDVEYAQAEALAKAVGKDDGFRFEPEGPGSLVFLPPMQEDDGAEKPDADSPSETVVFVSGTVIGSLPGETDERIALQRTWISCYDAHPSAGEAAGTIVLVPGMLGTPQPIIEGMIRYWRRAGYSVVRLLSHPSRFTERVEVAVAPGEEDKVGSALARLYDERTAECAYAAEAGIEHWLGARPALKDKPVVYVGMSGGAIVGPAVIGYAPGRYDAVVLIAGGVDFFSISATSNYAEWIDAVSMDWAPEDPGSLGEATPERLSRVSEAYLSASRLDGMKLAPNIAVPTLVLHATNDRAVPTRFGEVLWERLGRPERWVFSVGHELIFMMLPTQADRLDAWLTRTLVGDAGAPANP